MDAETNHLKRTEKKKKKIHLEGSGSILAVLDLLTPTYRTLYLKEGTSVLNLSSEPLSQT